MTASLVGHPDDEGISIVRRSTFPNSFQASALAGEEFSLINETLPP